MRTVMELFDVSPGVALVALGATAIVLIIAVSFFVRSAPPTSLAIASGPEGSIFQKNALKYAKILEQNGVKTTVVVSKGSLDNLQRLTAAHPEADVGIVQNGLPIPEGATIVSLGSISYQPVLVFYRGRPIELLSELAGKRVAIGAVGSGTHQFATTLLGANGIKENGSTTLLELDAEAASQALLAGKADAAFVMSESASSDILHDLLRASEIHLFNFKQASAYARKIESLNVLELPEGSIDLGLNIPPHDITLVGPMVELVAVKNLHPALSDLLLEAAVQVHGRPSMFQKRGEFPSAIEHSLHISEDAARYYKSGKSLLYRYLPFWLASLLSRLIVVFLPTLVILIPMLKSIPAFFRWRIRIKIRRRYRELLALEEDFLKVKSSVEREEIREHFDRIDAAVNKMRIPPAFADQFYGLRGHIDYVRQLVSSRH